MDRSGSASGSAPTRPQIAEQIPPIHIHYGVVQVDRPLPIVIRDAKRRPFAIIDTAGSEARLGETGARLLLARSHLYVHRPQRDTRIYDLSAVADFSLDRDTAIGWLGKLLLWSIPIMLLAVLVGLYLIRLVQVLIGAGIALLMARASRVPLAFDAFMRLVAVALTQPSWSSGCWTRRRRASRLGDSPGASSRSSSS